VMGSRGVSEVETTSVGGQANTCKSHA